VAILPSPARFLRREALVKALSLGKPTGMFIRLPKVSTSTGMACTGSVVALLRICMNWARTKNGSISSASCKIARHEGSLHQSVRPCARRSDEETGGYGRLGEPESTESAPNSVGQCGKMLKSNCGEVAERLNAAVC